MLLTKVLTACAALSLVACIPMGDAWIRFGGTVTDSNGHPIEGARVSVLIDGQPPQRGGKSVSNSQGHYSIYENSCPCEFAFTLKATANGFAPYEASLNGKEANELKVYDIKLERQ